MLVNHERRLLRKAAEARDSRISVHRKKGNSWPSDHSRLTALESDGHLMRDDGHEASDLHAVVATWRITGSGLTQLRTLSGAGA